MTDKPEDGGKLNSGVRDREPVVTGHEYGYRGMVVKYWDLLRGDTSQWSSRPYFLWMIHESGEPALDVGCGTGRLLLDYLSQGVDIDGVDLSPEMIGVCRENAERLGLNPSLFVQPMQDLGLPRRYQTIIVPSSSFLHLTDPGDARNALQRFYDHLIPGGTLAMSMRVFEPDPSAQEWEVVEEATRPSDCAVVRRWFRCTYDVPHRRQHTQDRYEIILEGEVLETESYELSPYLTWYLASEAVGLVERAGFVEVCAQRDFTREPATDADTRYVVIGRKS